MSGRMTIKTVAYPLRGAPLFGVEIYRPKVGTINATLTATQIDNYIAAKMPAATLAILGHDVRKAYFNSK